jgi:hypothetical protein
MTHRIVVDLQTGVITQVEYTPEEQAVHDAAVAAELAAQPTEPVQEVIAEPAQEAPATEPVAETPEAQP